VARRAFEIGWAAVQYWWMLAAMTDKAGSGDWFLPAPTVEAGWLLLQRPEPDDSSALHDAVAAVGASPALDAVGGELHR